MEILNAILHEVRKAKNSANVSTRLRPTELEVADDKNLAELILRLNELFTIRSGRAYGEFSEHSAFRANLDNFLNGDDGDDGPPSFVDWSHVAIDYLVNQLRSSQLATGGHMLFCRYRLDGEHYLFAVMLKNTSGVSIDEDLNLLSVSHIDLEKLHLAARINLERYPEQDAERYIAFVKGKHNRDVMSYFLSFLSVDLDSLEDAGRNTQDLVATIKTFASQYEEDQQKEIWDNAHNYCVTLSAANQPIDITVLSNHLTPTAPDAFTQFVGEGDYLAQNDFLLDQAKLKALTRVKGGHQGLSISFPRDLLGTLVRFERNPDRLVIDPIPANIKSQLMSGGEEPDSNESN